MFKDVIEKVINGESLTEEEMIDVMDQLMNGKLDDAQIGALLVALRIKGESLEEITGAAKVMSSLAKKIKIDSEHSVDIVGTGGDYANTFNISTASAIVAAAAGAVVAKHGNRSVSSKCGSADVLEALGIDISMDVETLEKCINELNMGFLFAPNFHSAMKYAIGPRKKIGVRTIFNILGPLTNPACVRNEIMGIYDENLTELAANVLKNMGLKRAMVVHGMDGIDEITVCDKTKVSFLDNGEIKTTYITPEDFGLNRYDKTEIVGGTPVENAEIIKKIFDGEKGAKRDAVLLNAGATIYVSGNAETLEKGIAKAVEMIDTGKAKQKLEDLIQFSKGAECGVI